MQRANNRHYDQIRPVRLVYDIFEYADGSVLLEIGKTKVLCAISITPGVPHFLRGKNQGWLTAGYSLLPTSTRVRVERESFGKRNDRSIEISRLIGRVLRSVMALDKIGEYTIYVDCDILQADGGTRTACITGACLALKVAQQRWLSNNTIKEPCITDDLVGMSAGIVEGHPLLDLDFIEDSNAQADFNFVFTKTGNLVEIQGTAEQEPISWDMLEHMKKLAHQGAQDMFACISSLTSLSASNVTIVPATYDDERIVVQSSSQYDKVV